MTASIKIDDIKNIHKTNNIDAIQVVVFFDENLCAPAAILAASLAETASQGRPVVLHVFCVGDFSEKFSEYIKKLTSSRFTFICRNIGNPFTKNDKIAYNNFLYCMRLCIGELLDCDRVIYLDTDILVCGSLDDLYDLNIGNNIIAAVPDIEINEIVKGANNSLINTGMTNVSMSDYCKETLGLTNDYFNSGVMLVNLQEWRNFKVKQKCNEFMNANILLIFCDQDALNYVLRDKVYFIDYKWNYYASSNELIKLDDPNYSPKIVHFSGPSKPWSPLGDNNRFNIDYWKFALSTSFGDHLLDKYFTRVSNEITGLEYQISAKSYAIPINHHPFNMRLFAYIPLPILRLVAEFMCTFGSARSRRTGIAMWDIYKIKLKLSNNNK